MAANLAPFRSSSDAASAPPPPTPWYITLPPAASRAMPSSARLSAPVWAGPFGRRRRRLKKDGSGGGGGRRKWQGATGAASEEREEGEREGLAQFCEAAARRWLWRRKQVICLREDIRKFSSSFSRRKEGGRKEEGALTQARHSHSQAAEKMVERGMLGFTRYVEIKCTFRSEAVAYNLT